MNVFKNLNDNELLEALNNYNEWNESGVIKNNTILASKRDWYCKEYEVHGTQIMERDLTGLRFTT